MRNRLSELRFTIAGQLFTGVILFLLSGAVLFGASGATVNPATATSVAPVFTTESSVDSQSETVPTVRVASVELGVTSRAGLKATQVEKAMAEALIQQSTNFLYWMITGHVLKANGNDAGYLAGLPVSSDYGTRPESGTKGDTSITRTNSEVPNRLFMDQNVPNPFSASTTIRYGLPRESHVRVTVFTMLGSPIRTLVEELQPAGVYNMNVDLSGLRRGLYFYRIETQYGNVTRRMTVS